MRQKSDILQERTETPRNPVRKVAIEDEAAGQRIDNFLRRELPGVPKGRLYRGLRKGEVRVNGGRVRAEYRLRPGDEVRIPPLATRPPRSIAHVDGAHRLLARIVFEDERLLVVNKPAGLAVHGGSGIDHGVIELMRAARPELEHLSLVHRLDRETSGVLVLAKRRSMLRSLHALFRERRVEKNYLALVDGDWQHGAIAVKAPLEVQHRHNGERHVIVSDDGSRAHTQIRLIKRFATACLVQCQPHTGRTHQIRVHTAHKGHAILGDDRYGDARVNRMWKKRGLERMFLHAQSIAFPDGNGNELHFSAPLSERLSTLLDSLSTR